MSDDSLAVLEPDEETEAASSAAVEDAEPDSPPQPVCAHCGAPADGGAWCRFCGYVPRLGTFVEPDPIEQQNPAQPQVWWKLIPRWIWVVAGGLAAVLTLSIVGRFATEAGSVPRMSLALGELGLGTVLFCAAHCRSYLYAIMENTQLGVVDILIKPMTIWGPTVQGLPATLARVLCGSCGLTSALCGPLIVGGIPYEAIWELGPRAQPKQNLVQAIASQAGKARGNAKDLEEAVKGFAGEKGDGEGATLAAKVKEEAQSRRVAECVIIGYKPLGENEFSELLLVSVVDEKLRIVGSVTQGIEPKAREEINRKLPTLKTSEPLVPTRLTGYVWVEPRLACKVRYRDWTLDKRLDRPVFDEMMTELSR